MAGSGGGVRAGEVPCLASLRLRIRFRSVGAAQRFLSAFSGISPRFRPRRHLLTATDYRAEMTVRFAIWDQVTGVAGLPTTP